MVGVSVAWHLRRQGRDVTLIDRRQPGSETSHGNAGLRLTTGAELNMLGAPPRYGQLAKAEQASREIFALGARRDDTPWLGNRPCMADMKPVIGPAHRHDNLWFAFGHGHQGFTLGPTTGRLLAAIMTGQQPAVDMTLFASDRFA